MEIKDTRHEHFAGIKGLCHWN